LQLASSIAFIDRGCRWNAYHCNVDENVIRHVAQAFDTYGLADVGYEFVNIGEPQCCGHHRTSAMCVID